MPWAMGARRLDNLTRDLKVTHTPVANWKLEIATASKKVG